jgi:adenylate kinase family enzyme
MHHHRILIIGNSGSGKTTMARALAAQWGVPVLSLDAIAWAEGVQRRPQDDCTHDILKFINEHEQWIMEGCYASLAEAALPHCTELLFLNPGIEVCEANCRARPWEPDKFATPTEQDAMFANLIDWVRQYDTRQDEFGLKQHRAIYNGFAGAKREVKTLPELDVR